jgi:hypothetical protein
MLPNRKSLASKFVHPSQRWKILILENWPKIAGHFTKYIFLHRVMEEEVVIAVSHPCWGQEVKMASTQLLKNINTEIGEERIKKIKTIVKRKKNNNKPQQYSNNDSLYKKTNNLNTKDDTLSKDELAVLQKIKTPGLRESIKKILMSSKSLESSSNDQICFCKTKKPNN